MGDVTTLSATARRLRREALEMLYAAQSGHPGSALSTMDMLVTLYLSDTGLESDPKRQDDPNRDHFLLSNGHACPALYVVLAEAGYFDKKELAHLRQLDSPAQGHPHRGSLPGIEISSGSLGQGLSVGIGLAQAKKLGKRGGQVFVMMSDGEQEEGSTWEAVMLAPKLGLDNLVAIVDKNGFQIDGATADVMPPLDPLADKWRAFNWNVTEISGHDFGQIIPALSWAKEAGGPAVIIAETVRGKGVSFMEKSDHWHAGAISEEQYGQAMRELAD